MRITTLSLFIGLSALSYSSVLRAADKEYCEQYARTLINLPNEDPTKKRNILKVCQKNQPHWSNDKAKHLKWCLGVSQAEADKKLYNHNKLVNLCNDTYKLIMIDRNRCANLPLSPDDPQEMTPASSAIKALLTNPKIYSSVSPYAKLYPALTDILNNNEAALKKCHIYSLPVDIDNNPETKDWVVSLEQKCLPKLKNGHIWLVQQTGENYRILLESEANTLTLHYSETNHYKNITVASQLSPAEETEKRCGSIIADWQYKEGRYLPVKGTADIHGSCLPEYNLPDNLQGANTFDLAEGEWEKAMQEQEKKRTALYSPYKKALEAYIPEWIKKTTEQISIVPRPNVAAIKLHKNNEASTTEKESGFFHSIRTFLGIDK